MKFNVTEIEFDFDDGDFDDPITFEEQVQITHDNLGVWDADDEDDLSDMLSATGKFSITLDEIVQNFMPYIPLYLIENEDEIKQAFPDRITDDEYIFIYDRDMTPNEITLNVEWLD